MEKTWKVEFRNVGSSYFPQSRVECHYSISSQHSWASNDWIGLFKVTSKSLFNCCRKIKFVFGLIGSF
uniref:SKICH domain-containing protein n=1 Tax=Astyanax mexicanus TaxID=7994 RepID=A0A8B9HJ79_ASTMX